MRQTGVSKMTRVFSYMVLCSLMLVLSGGCSSALNEVNKGAKGVGKAGGQIIRIPNSVSEGISEGIAGEPESNPYNR